MPNSIIFRKIMEHYIPHVYFGGFVGFLFRQCVCCCSDVILIIICVCLFVCLFVVFYLCVSLFVSLSWCFASVFSVVFSRLFAFLPVCVFLQGKKGGTNQRRKQRNKRQNKQGATVPKGKKQGSEQEERGNKTTCKGLQRKQHRTQEGA